MQFQKGQSGNPAGRREDRETRHPFNWRSRTTTTSTFARSSDGERWVMNRGHFPVISLLFPVPDPASSADVIVYTQFFAVFGCCPAPFTGIYRQGHDSEMLTDEFGWRNPAFARSEREQSVVLPT